MDTEKINKMLGVLRRLDDAQEQLYKAINSVQEAQEDLKKASLAYSKEFLEMIKKERV